MRDFSTDHRWLSLNTATVRKQGDLAAIVDACARHGIRAIDPWRDQVAAIGLDRALRIAARFATTTAARSMKPRHWARHASCWWSAACRNIRGRAARPRRTSLT